MLFAIFLINLAVIALEVGMIVVFLQNAFDLLEHDSFAPFGFALIASFVGMFAQMFLMLGAPELAQSLGWFLVPMCIVLIPITVGLVSGLFFGVLWASKAVAQLGRKVKEMRRDWTFHRDLGDE